LAILANNVNPLLTPFNTNQFVISLPSPQFNPQNPSLAMSSPPETTKFKVCVIGLPQSGKSSFCQQFLHGTFDENYSPSKGQTVDTCHHQLELWDYDDPRLTSTSISIHIYNSNAIIILVNPSELNWLTGFESFFRAFETAYTQQFGAFGTASAPTHLKKLPRVAIVCSHYDKKYHNVDEVFKTAKTYSEQLKFDGGKIDVFQISNMNRQAVIDVVEHCSTPKGPICDGQDNHIEVDEERKDKAKKCTIL